MPGRPPGLPEDGARVRGMTYPSVEYDRDAEEVSGELATRPVPALGYTQCWVDGVQVDPETVRAVAAESVAEDRAGLVPKKVQRADGVTTTVWVRPDDAAHVPDSHPYQQAVPAEHVLSGLGEKIAAADPEAAKNPKLLERIKDKSLTVAAKAYTHLVRATPAMLKLMDVAGAIFDTPEDMKKFGYNPTVSSGTASPQTLDPVKNELGISTHLAATIATHVISAGLTWVRRKLGIAESADVDFAGFAALLRDALAAAADELGLPEPPDAWAVESALRALAAKE